MPADSFAKGERGSDKCQVQQPLEVQVHHCVENTHSDERARTTSGETPER